LCTVVLLRRPGHDWPLILGANRDERLDRAWDPPAAWWPGHPGVVGGRDRGAGGTWMAAGPSGVVAAVLNRPGSLGPAAGLRSRGELPLLAAGAESAAAGASRILALPVDAWRPFNLVVADTTDAVFVRATGAGRAECFPLANGVSMVTAHDPNDPGSPRIARHLPRFRAADAPAPAGDDWSAWASLLADDSIHRAVDDTLRVPPTDGFGTVSTSLLAYDAAARRRWRFAPVMSGEDPLFQDVG